MADEPNVEDTGAESTEQAAERVALEAGQKAADPPNAPPSDPPANLVTDPPEDPPEVKPDWPDDWRDKLAGDDKKAAKFLERHNSPTSVFKALQSLRSKMSAGDLKAPLAENASEEEVTAWRKDNGIPEAPEGYLENLPDGVVLGDNDKPLFEGLSKFAHERNLSPDVVHGLTKWWLDEQEQLVAADRDFQLGAKQGAEDELRAEFGNDYRRQLNRLNGFLDQLPEELRDPLKNARLGDEGGTPLFSSPPAVKWFLDTINELNPAVSVVPGAQNPGAAINDEIAEIGKFMRSNRKAYNKDEKMQARYRELLDARNKIQAAA